MIMKIAVRFPTPLHIRIQPVIVHNLKFSLTSFSKNAGGNRKKERGPETWFILTGVCQVVRKWSRNNAQIYILN